ncbi:PKD domain-containing protein, partial [Candidatus Woesearchaeota archaeon]|nr:PKD domain-containing protein [Candidatus Woesearchaeota archaeon]
EWSWTNPVDIDFDHVELWLNGSFVTNATGTSYNFTGLVAETLYTVEVITVDSTGNRNSPGVMDNATTIPVDLFPVVSASASPLSGSLPLLVDFDANVTGGDAPVSIEWDFDSDGVVDSTSEDPSYVYNLAGDYTAVVNVTDADGDWASDSVNISVSGDTHDVAVLSVEHSKSLTTAYLWDVINVTSEVENQGTVAESVDVELEVDGVVVDTATVVIPVGVSVNTTLSFNATVEGFNTVVVRAVPVVGESDLSDQTESTSVRVWSVDDIVGMSTREIFLSTPVVAQGMSFTVFLPLQNDYALEEFQDMRVLMWSSNGTAFDVTDDLKFVDLGAGEMVLVEWSVTALPVGSGTYTISAVLGNDELDESNITSKMIMVV